jgi:hypothetical protein
VRHREEGDRILVRGPDRRCRHMHTYILHQSGYQRREEVSVNSLEGWREGGSEWTLTSDRFISADRNCSHRGGISGGTCAIVLFTPQEAGPKFD